MVRGVGDRIDVNRLIDGIKSLKMCKIKFYSFFYFIALIYFIICLAFVEGQ